MLLNSFSPYEPRQSWADRIGIFILLTVSLVEKVQKLRFPATPGAAVSSLCGYKALLAR